MRKRKTQIVAVSVSITVDEIRKKFRIPKTAWVFLDNLYMEEPARRVDLIDIRAEWKEKR